jgi:hypothetical protein
MRALIATPQVSAFAIANRIDAPQLAAPSHHDVEYACPWFDSVCGWMVHAAETRALATASHDRRALNRVQVGKAQRGRFNAVVEKKSISWTAATRANTSKPAGNVAAIVV